MGNRGRRRSWLAAQVGRRLLVHATPEAGGHSLDGVLVRVDADALVLSGVAMPEASWQRLGGTVQIPRGSVAFVQGDLDEEDGPSHGG